MYRVYAQSHAPCDDMNPGTPLRYQTFERGGQFYLNIKEGWVMVPEGLFPQILGFWLKMFGLAGPGDPKHSAPGYYQVVQHHNTHNTFSRIKKGML
jgi:hypothetical protein